MGADFPPDRFVRTPIRVIRWTLSQLDNKDKAQANVNSISTARLTGTLIQVAHAFSGSKRAAPKQKLQEFLPYPDWKPTSAQASEPDAGTKFVLAELIKQRKIPIHVFMGLMTPAA
jgi:hypothetical protein